MCEQVAQNCLQHLACAGALVARDPQVSEREAPKTGRIRDA